MFRAPGVDLQRIVLEREDAPAEVPRARRRARSSSSRASRRSRAPRSRFAARRARRGTGRSSRATWRERYGGRKPCARAPRRPPARGARARRGTRSSEQSGAEHMLPPVRAELTVEIARTPEEVFAYLTDVSNLPPWQSGVHAAPDRGRRRAAAGARIRESRHMLGRELSTTLEIDGVRARRGSSRCARSTVPCRSSVRHELEPSGRRDAADGRGEGDAGLLPGFAAGIMARRAEKQFRKDFERLKRLLESVDAPRPSSRTQHVARWSLTIAARLHRRPDRRRADEAEAGRLQPLRELLRLRRLRVPVRRRRAARRSSRARYDHTSSCSGVPASRSSSTPRAFAIAASILPRWRTMPASPSRRSTSRSPKRATASGSNPANARAEVLALAQDRQPREPRLEALEAEPLVESALVRDRPPPLLVVVGDVERVGRRPAAGTGVRRRRHGRRRRRSAPGTSRPARTRAATSGRPVARSNAEPWRGQTTRARLLVPLALAERAVVVRAAILDRVELRRRSCRRRRSVPARR